ncbi:MAG: type II toxin-antitoxin system RelE family toxin [Halothece sp.]
MVSHISKTASTPDELDSLINVETTKAFEKDLQKLHSKEQEKASSKIDQIVELIKDNISPTQHKDLTKMKIQLAHYTPSLYLLKITRDLRVFLFLVDDPIFNQKIITLLQVFPHQDMDKVLRGLANHIINRSYYSNMI